VQLFVDQAARVTAVIGDAPLYSLRWINLTDGGYEWKINEEFRLYLGRTIPRVTRDEFESWIQQRAETTYILVRPAPDADVLLRRLGLTLVERVMVDKNDQQVLWMWPGQSSS
jgi:hypothetical protein